MRNAVNIGRRCRGSVIISYQKTIIGKCSYRFEIIFMRFCGCFSGEERTGRDSPTDRHKGHRHAFQIRVPVNSDLTFSQS